MDIDRHLHEAGQRWRESQGPALQPPSAASLEEAPPPRQWRKGLAPMAAAAAVAAIIFGFVSVHGSTTGAQQLPAGSVTTPSPSVSSPSTEPSTSAARIAAKAAAAKAEAARAAAYTEMARRLLTFPPKSAGELARVVYVPHAKTRTLREAPITDSLVVRAACSASAPGATVTYEVLDSRPSTPETQRLLSSGQVPCDGTVTVNGASPLVGHSISINLTDISELVTRAYALIVPQ